MLVLDLLIGVYYNTLLYCVLLACKLLKCKLIVTLTVLDRVPGASS